MRFVGFIIRYAMQWYYTALIIENTPKYTLSYILEAHCKHDKLRYKLFMFVRVKMGISKVYTGWRGAD